MYITSRCDNILEETGLVCGFVWNAYAPIDMWLADACALTCPSCGHVAHQQEGHMSIAHYELPLAVVLFAQDAEGRLLAISRRDDETQFGLPGGKVDVEDGPCDPEHLFKTLVDALVREVVEETGVSLDRTRVHLVYQCPDPTGYWNFCFATSESVAPSTQPGEGVVAWVSWDVLERGPFGEFNRALREHLGC